MIWNDLCKTEIKANLHEQVDELWSEMVSDMRNGIFDDVQQFSAEIVDCDESDIKEDTCFVTKEFTTGMQKTAENNETLTSASATNKSDSEDNKCESKSNKGVVTQLNKAIYKGASVRLSTAFLILSLFMMKHNLAQTTMDDVLSILCFLLPVGTIMAQNFKEFRRLFMKMEYPLLLHYYCSNCLMPIQKKEAQVCKNDNCQKNLTVRGSVSYFIEIPLIDQIQSFFKRPDFYSSLQHRFKRKNDGKLRDIYDGQMYKSLVSKGILDSPDNISFILNTDGAPIFKSSNVSIWPIYLIINALPIKQRMKKENMLFSGLWFGNKKPLMLSFLGPTALSLQKLEAGVEMNAPERGNFKLRAVLIGCICDLPARAILTNHVQYNGSFSCPKCLQKGITHQVGARGHTHVFPFNTENPKGPERTSESVKEDAVKAQKNIENGLKDFSVNGVKGPSWLMDLKRFDVVRAVNIDYMHGVLLGIQKLLLNRWFSHQHSKQSFSIADKVDIVDRKISEIKLSSAIKRMPRSISDTLKYWKASKFRSFLLYFRVPCMFGVLPSHLLSHYILLVHATYVLLKDGIDETDLKEAEECLTKFVQHFPVYYGLRFSTLNVHQLLHLVDEVRDLGPLYTHDCFSFEDKNRVVLNFIHGTQAIASQLIDAVRFTQNIPQIICSELTQLSESFPKSLIDQLATTYPLPKPQERITKNIQRLGACVARCLSQTELDAVEGFLGFYPLSQVCCSFNHILLKG